MPGLRVFRCLRPPFVHARQDRPVAREDPARRAARADGACAARSRGRYDAVHSHEEGGAHRRRRSRRCCGCRTSTTCTRACRSSSRTSRSAGRASSRGVFLAIERFMIRRSRVVIVICPSLEETVRGDRSGRADRADRERARARPRTRRRPARRRGRAPRRSSLDADDAGRALHRHVRGLSGARSAVRRDGDRAARRGPTRGSCWPAASRIRSTKAREQARAAGHRRTSRCSPASGRPRRFRPICSPRDVLVSPRSRGTNTPLKIYQYLRSGKPIVATRLLTHTQVLSDETAILTGATPRGVCRRHPRRRSTIPTRAAGDRPARARSWPRPSTATRPTSRRRARPAPRCCRRRRAGAVVKDVA